jgi:hypothetical protein
MYYMAFSTIQYSIFMIILCNVMFAIVAPGEGGRWGGSLLLSRICSVTTKSYLAVSVKSTKTACLAGPALVKSLLPGPVNTQGHTPRH